MVIKDYSFFCIILGNWCFAKNSSQNFSESRKQKIITEKNVATKESKLFNYSIYCVAMQDEVLSNSLFNSLQLLNNCKIWTKFHLFSSIISYILLYMTIWLLNNIVNVCGEATDAFIMIAFCGFAKVFENVFRLISKKCVKWKM